MNQGYNADINWDEFTFRCSALGYIMVDPKEGSNADRYVKAVNDLVQANADLAACSEKAVKTKDKLKIKIAGLNIKIAKLEKIKDIPNLSETCKSYLSDVYTAVVYGRKTEDIRSKYLEKGLLLEEDAITNYCLLTGEFHKKNKERKRNNWIEGENDFYTEEWINDIKVNWSVFQFNRIASKPMKKGYKWQLQGYMWLWEVPRARLIYSLVDTPEHLIKIEEKKLLYDFVGSEQDYKDACEELRHNHIYTDIPLDKKVRTLEMATSEDDVIKIIKRVEDCRWYLKNFENHYKQEEDENDN